MLRIICFIGISFLYLGINLKTKVMKNIHVLPTDKPSRLVKQKYDTIDRLCLADIATKRAEYKRFNIYITSDEFIEEVDFGLHLSTKKIVQYDGIKGLDSYYKKIILTTDQDLIADGVQAIDDEFLEWFVKNPSCEKVDVDKAEHGMYKDDVYYKLSNKIFYKIIIPKEEQTKCYCGHTTYCDCGPEEPKQKTLEEATEKKYGTSIYDFDPVDAFIEGAKWQQEKSYSEEEVLEILKLRLKWFRILPDEFEDNKWFEQFKKK